MAPDVLVISGAVKSSDPMNMCSREIRARMRFNTYERRPAMVENRKGKKVGRKFGSQTNDLIYDPKESRIRVETNTGFREQTLTLQMNKGSERYFMPLTEDFVQYLHNPPRYERNGWYREIRKNGRTEKVIVVTSDIHGDIIFSVWDEIKQSDRPMEIFVLPAGGLNVLFDVVNGIGGRALIEANKPYFEQIEGVMEAKMLADERKTEDDG